MRVEIGTQRLPPILSTNQAAKSRYPIKVPTYLWPSGTSAKSKWVLVAKSKWVLVAVGTRGSMGSAADKKAGQRKKRRNIHGSTALIIAGSAASK